MYPCSLLSERFSQPYVSVWNWEGSCERSCERQYCSGTNSFLSASTKVMNYKVLFFSLWRGQQSADISTHGKTDLPCYIARVAEKKVSNELQGVDAGDEPAPLPVKPRQMTRDTKHLWNKYKLIFKVCISLCCLWLSTSSHQLCSLHVSTLQPACEHLACTHSAHITSQAKLGLLLSLLGLSRCVLVKYTPLCIEDY